MKQTSGPVYDSVRKSYVNNVVPVLTAEWNLNRYYRTVVDNTPSEDSSGYDIEYFPIDSITKPDRPVAGIAKAAVGQALVSSDHYDVVPSARYYSVSTTDVYKYWQSPVTSDVASPYNFANHTDGISMVRPRVEYVEEDDVSGAPVGRLVKANKIYICVENTFASPDDFTIQIKTSVEGAWTTIATNPTIQSDGRIELWYQGGTTWNSTKNYSNSIDIYAIQMVVNSMNVPSAYFNLIEMGARLEQDLTPDIASINDTLTLAEPDWITPLGTISTNTGSVTLFNEHAKYSKDNPSSILYGLLDKNVKFNLSYRYDGVNDIQQFELFSDAWNESQTETVVNLVDGAKFFMEQPAPVVLYRDISVQEAVWRLCDAVGFNKYEVSSQEGEAFTKIDVFWTTGEQSVWEVFQELSRGTQTAIYFDAYGVLQVKTRGAAFEDKPSDWVFREVQSGDELPDIIDLDEEAQYEANKVKISYQPTGFSEAEGENVVPFSVVWEPEDTIVLRSSQLIKTISSTDMFVHIPAADAIHWPYKGIIQIEGEWISYDGKVYSHYIGTNTSKSYTTVKSAEDKARLDAKTPADKKHLNSFSGNLAVSERGLWNTGAQAHDTATLSWFKTLIRKSGTTVDPGPGFKHNVQDSTVTLSGPAKRKFDDYLYMHRGNSTDQGWRRLGTRMRIDKSGHTDKCAGIFFNSGSLGAGYFVDVMATAKMSAATRKKRNEVIFYSKKTDGSRKVFGGERRVVDNNGSDRGGKVKKDMGAEVAVVQGEYIDIDIWFREAGTSHHVQVYVNGTMAIDAVISEASGWKQPFVSRFGLFARGHTSATFEYIYGAPESDYFEDSTDEDTFYDRIRGGFVGNHWERDHVYETRTVRKKIRKKWTTVTQRYNQRFFDEFGPIVHEIREFKVKWNTDGLPVLESKLFNSNETQVVCTEFTHDVAGATFVLANSHRNNAVVYGEDTLTAGADNAINQKLFVYGRPVIQKDAKEIIKTDDWAVRRRGVIETEYASKWIQNDAAAEALADWLTSRWTRSDTIVSVEAFGNPLIELTDVVGIEYDDMTATTHKYFVTAISTSFDGGLNTTFTLRRATI